MACVLVDNAANMTKTVELINEQQSEDKDENQTSEETEEEITNIGRTIYHMRCAKHTFQLGMREALEERKTRKVPIKDTQICSVPTFPTH